jgi:adenine deaminase
MAGIRLTDKGEDMNTKAHLKHIIDVASGRSVADLCITGAKILDVYNKEFFESDLLIANGFFAAFAEAGTGEAERTVDAEGRYLLPGFIDCHVHIESSHATPEEFSNLVVPCGTTTAICDPHELCNVTGLDGLYYMLDATEETAVQAFFMVPSCVPATSFEHSGAKIGAKDVVKPLSHPRVLGLGEMMDYPGVIAADNEVLEKIIAARTSGKVVDGHSPEIVGRPLDAYASARIRTEHECESVEEMQARIRRGMYILLREGSASHNVLTLLGGVTEGNIRRCCFCTDDRQPKSILEEGHINNNVRLAVQAGLDPIEAICMATINSSDCYNLTDRGAIAPGLRADFVLADNVTDFTMHQVYVKGTLVAQDGKMLQPAIARRDERVASKVNIKDFSVERLRLKLASDHVRVIQVIEGSVATDAGEARVTVQDGLWVHDPGQDIVKLAVVERHKGTGNVGVALLGGLGLKAGAMATTVGHDSHNLIVCGTNDGDMAVAVEHLKKIGGGMVIVKGGEVLTSFAQPIAGLMSYEDGPVIARALDEIHRVAHRELGVHPHIDPFMTLGFMALPVIPSYKLTDMGLFDVRTFDFIPMEIST